MTTSAVDAQTGDMRALATASVDRTRNGVTSDMDGTLVSIGGGVFLTAGHVLFRSSDPTAPRPAEAYRLKLADGLTAPREIVVEGPDFSGRVVNFGWAAGGPDMAAVLTGDAAAPAIPLIVWADPDDASGALSSFGYPAGQGGAMVQTTGSLSPFAHREFDTPNGPATVWVSDGGMQVVSGQSGSGVWLTSDPDGDGVAETRLAGILTMSATTAGQPAAAFEPLGDIYAALATMAEAAGLSADLFARAALVAGQAPASAATTVTGTYLHEHLVGGLNDDTLDGGAGNDILSGGLGADRLIDGAGKDLMRGGAGADTFVLSADGATDRIDDLQRGLDRIDVSAWGVRDLSGLTLYDHHSGRVILRFGSEVVALDDGARGLRAADFRASDFVFASGAAPMPVIEGTDGNDRLIGTVAAEELRDLGGVDNLFGRGGADRFVLALDGATDSIKDFEDGLDLIDLTAWGVGFADLAISDNGAGKAVVAWGDELLVVSDVGRTLTAADLTEADFILA